MLPRCGLVKMVGLRWWALLHLGKGRAFSTSLTAGWMRSRYLVGAMLGVGNCIHIVQQVSALEEVSYYQLSREEEKVNDNMIKLTRAVNQDLTPTI